MNWVISHRADPAALRIADRHYNRQKPGTSQFVPPGRCFVLISLDYGSLWVTSWPYAKYVKHAWAGAWMNSMFRRESGKVLASQLILEAIAATKWFYGDPPKLGMVTFIDRGKVKTKRDYGYCYRMAGFEEVGETKGGLLALRLPPDKMPEAQAPWERIKP